jgi:hypothetical protein
MDIAAQENQETYLSDNHWTLHVSIRLDTEPNTYKFKDIEIQAAYDTYKIWNRRFWSLFPPDGPEFLSQIQSHFGIVVSTRFPFRPTVSLKSPYGQHSLFKIERLAGQWLSRLDEAPTNLR